MRSFLFCFCFFFGFASAAQIDSLLFAAIRQNDTLTIAKRLNEKLDINATDKYGANALMWATYYCELPVIKALVHHGAKPPANAKICPPDDETFFYSLQTAAVKQERLDVLQYLADSLYLPLKGKGEGLRNLYEPDRSPLYHAAVYGRIKIINFLLQRGLQPDVLEDEGTETALFIALNFENFDAFRILLKTDAYKHCFGTCVDSVLTASGELERLNIHGKAKGMAIQKFALPLRKIFFGEESPGYAMGLYRLGVAYNVNGNTDSGELYHRRAMACLERTGKKSCPLYYDCLMNLVFGCYNTARYSKALNLLAEAMEVLRKIYPVEIYNQYTVSLTKADALPPRTPVVWPTAFALSFYGVVYSRMGQYGLALKYFRQSLAITEEVSGEDVKYGFVANLMAAAYAGVGLYGEALPLYVKSLAIKKTLGEDNDAYGGNLLDLGYAYNQTGQYKDALPCFEQAAVIIKKWFGEKHQYYAMCMDGEAYVYEHIGEYEKAVAKYTQAFTIYKDVFNEGHPYCAFVLNNLATLYKTTGRYKDAFACYRQALSIRQKSITENHPDYAQNLSNLAALHAESGDEDSARLLYRQALSLIQKNLSKEHPYYAATLVGLAKLSEKRRNADSALLLYTEALALNKRIFGESFPDNIDILNQLGNLHRFKGNRTQATHYFTDACRLQLAVLNETYASLSESEKLAFVQKATKTFTYLPSYLYKHPEIRRSLARQLYQNELSLKAMVAEDQRAVLNAIRQSNDSALLDLYKQWQFNKAILGKEQLRSKKERSLAFDSLQEAVNGLEQELSRRSLSFQIQKQQRRCGVTDVAQNLRLHEAAVEFIRFRYYNRKWTDSVLYAALVLLPADSVPHFIPLCEEKALQRLLTVPKNTDTVYALQKIYRPENSSRPDVLYRLIWKPLQPYLQGVHTIYFAPAGLLHGVAFSALRDESSRCLINRYTLRQVMSTRSVALSSSAASLPASAGLWGGIQYNATAKATTVKKTAASSDAPSAFNLYTADTKGVRGGEFLPLPNTKKEIALLKESFRGKGVPTVLYSGAAATEEAFKALDGNSPQVLHLATHGFFLPVVKRNGEAASANTFTVQENPLFRSGLVLAGGNAAWKGNEPATGEDGILTAYEMAQLDLSRTDLMVLSACETALGDVKANEGVIGLQRAIRLAGVKKMVVSLWKVPDKETVELMTAFYRFWFNGAATAEALRKAQLKMKQQYPPFYWAAFVLIE